MKYTLITVYGIPNCDTVKKARTWLSEQGIEHVFHDFKKQGLPEKNLDSWLKEAGWESVLNRKGTSWRKLTPEERAAWKTLNLAPVDDFDIVKKQYKRLVKENHPDKNGGDAQAEERLKDINLAYSLIRKTLANGDKPATSQT